MTYLILGIIALITFGLRTIGQWGNVFTDNGVWYRGVDAWYHMRLVDDMMVNFPIPISWDMLASFPDGYPVGYYPLYSWLIAIPGFIFDYEVVGALLPPILMALLIFPVYLLGKEVFNSKTVGIIAALLVAVLPTELAHRSLLGFTDHHILETFLATLTLLFLVRHYKYSKRRDVILSGIFLGLYMNTWIGGLLLVLVVLTYFVLINIYNKWKNVSSTTFNKDAILIFLITAILSTISIPFIQGHDRYTLMVGLALLGMIGIYYLAKKSQKIFITGLIGLSGIGATILLVGFPDLLEGLQYVLFGNIHTGINEAQPTTIGVAMTLYGITIIPFGIGLFFAIKYKISPVFIIWTLFILIITLAQRRWGYYMTIPLALTAAFGLVGLVKYIDIKARKVALIFTMAFLFIISAPNMVTLAISPIQYNNTWHQTLIWLRDNTEENAPILTWWDYGHWIIRTAERPAVVSPTVGGKPWIAQYFVSNNVEEAEVLISQEIKWLIITDDMLEGLWWAIVQYAQYDPNTANELREDSNLLKIWKGEHPNWVFRYGIDKLRVFERISIYYD